MLGALVGLAGSIGSGLMSYFNNKKMQDTADKEYARQEAYNKAKAAEDPLSRADNRRMLAQYDRQAERQLEQATNTAAVMGGMPEYTAAVQKGIAEGRANLMGNMAAQNSKRVDEYEAAAENARINKFAAEQERKAARNEIFANLASNAANAAQSLVGAYDDKKSETANEPAKKKAAAATPAPAASTPARDVSITPSEQKQDTSIAVTTTNGLPGDKERKAALEILQKYRTV